MLWIIFVLLNIFGNGTALFLTKSAIKDTKLGYSGVMFVSLFFAVLWFFPVFIYSFKAYPHIFSNTNGIYYVLASIATTVCAFFLYIHALKLNDLSVFGPLDTLRPFFVVLFSFLLLNQYPESGLFFGILFTVTGALVLTLKKQFFSEVGNLKKTFFIIASTATFGLAGVLDKKTLLYMDPFKYTFFILLSVCLAYGILYLHKHKSIYRKHFLSQKLLLIGFLWATGYIGIMIALKLATPNQVIPLQMTRSLYLSVLGFIFLHEKGYVRKVLAAILMLVGVIFITH